MPAFELSKVRAIGSDRACGAWPRGFAQGLEQFTRRVSYSRNSCSGRGRATGRSMSGLGKLLQDGWQLIVVAGLVEKVRRTEGERAVAIGGDGEIREDDDAWFGQAFPDSLENAEATAGMQLQVEYHGVDVTSSARLQNGLVVQGGLAVGKQTTDNCAVRDALPEIAPTNPYCHVEQGLQTQVKFFATYLIPKIDVLIAGTFQNNPGYVIPANFAVPAANIVGLGRPLSSGATTVSYNLIEPNSLYGDRVTQVDIRFSKVFRTGDGSRLSINFDMANALNRNDILGATGTYGAAWQTPTGILDPRLYKLGLQFDY